MSPRSPVLVAALIFILGSGGTAGDGRLNVVATTSIVGDVVAQIGGDEIDLIVLLPRETDPHAFDPTPKDVAAISAADVVFVNGGGLEAYLEPVLATASRVVSVSEGITFRTQEDRGVDPHVWFDPANVMVWVDNIASALSELDPTHSREYNFRAESYRKKLAELDAWIQDQVEKIPLEQRILVTDHAALGYFVDRYGFKQLGAIIPGFSTLAEPSARELAELSRAIRELSVPAIFVGTAVNPALAEQVAADTGSRIVFLYIESLSKPGGLAENYIDFMRYNVATIVAALGGCHDS